MFSSKIFSLLGFLVLTLSLVKIWYSSAQLTTCQANCQEADRLVGPTRMLNTRDHPWATARFPSTNSGFCELGCTIFYNEVPRNITCKNLCGYFYRYEVTTGYSDLATEALLECQDGCDIGLQICDAGYFCNNGEMLPCPAGTFREPVANLSIIALNEAHVCTKCPFGRYRSTLRGASPDDCSLCPFGYYVNAKGSTSENDCVRASAGENAASMGMRLPVCMTDESCGVTMPRVDGKEYYSNGIDYYRETIPFIGRW